MHEFIPNGVGLADMGVLTSRCLSKDHLTTQRWPFCEKNLYYSPTLPQPHGNKVTVALQTLKQSFMRALNLKCPACGRTSIVARPFHIKHHCQNCYSIYKREEGFFVGAILANVVITELIVLGVCFFALLILGFAYESVLWLLFSLAIIFPIGFFHHSWSFWLTLDYLVEGLPKIRGPGR